MSVQSSRRDSSGINLKTRVIDTPIGG